MSSPVLNTNLHKCPVDVSPVLMLTIRGCDNCIRVSCSAGYGFLSWSENWAFGGDANFHSVAVGTTVVGSDGTT